MPAHERIAGTQDLLIHYFGKKNAGIQPLMFKFICDMNSEIFE